MPCPLIGLFKPFKTRPSLTTLKSLISIRWCWKTKLRWLFPCARWYPCRLFILLSKSTSSRWSRCSKLVIGRGTKFFMFHLSIGRGMRNSKSSTCLFGVGIECLRMKDLSLSCLPILTSSPSPSTCFLCGMGITSCMLGCLTLIISTMMSLLGTFHLIPLWNEFVVLQKGKKFPKLGFFDFQFNKWLHKATFWHQVFWFWMTSFFSFFSNTLLISLLFLQLEIEVLKFFNATISNFSLVVKKVPYMISLSSYIQ